MVCEVEFWKAVYTVGSPLRSLAEVLNLAAETIKKRIFIPFLLSLLVPRLTSPGTRILSSFQLAL